MISDPQRHGLDRNSGRRQLLSFFDQAVGDARLAVDQSQVQGRVVSAVGQVGVEPWGQGGHPRVGGLRRRRQSWTRRCSETPGPSAESERARWPGSPGLL